MTQDSAVSVLPSGFEVEEEQKDIREKFSVLLVLRRDILLGSKYIVVGFVVATVLEFARQTKCCSDRATTAILEIPSCVDKKEGLSETFMPFVSGFYR